MIITVRTTTGRENIVIDGIEKRVKSKGLNIKSVFHPEELRGYIFIEADNVDEIEEAIRGIPHVRGIIPKNVKFSDVERFLIPEKQEVKVEENDIVEIIGGPFKGEKAKVKRVDEAKNEITVELLEAAIPIPVTISTNSVRIIEKSH